MVLLGEGRDRMNRRARGACQTRTRIAGDHRRAQRAGAGAASQALSVRDAGSLAAAAGANVTSSAIATSPRLTQTTQSPVLP